MASALGQGRQHVALGPGRAVSLPPRFQVVAVSESLSTGRDGNGGSGVSRRVSLETDDNTSETGSGQLFAPFAEAATFELADDQTRRMLVRHMAAFEFLKDPPEPGMTFSRRYRRWIHPADPPRPDAAS
jgi:hypothetical protein